MWLIYNVIFKHFRYFWMSIYWLRWDIYIPRANNMITIGDYLSILFERIIYKKISFLVHFSWNYTRISIWKTLLFFKNSCTISNKSKLGTKGLTQSKDAFWIFFSMNRLSLFWQCLPRKTNFRWIIIRLKLNDMF